MPLLRSLISGLVLAFAGSRANISRTILSCAGIVVGVGALIAVVTAGHFGQTYAKVYGEANGGIAATYEVTAPTPLKDVGAFEEDMLRAGGEAVALQQMVDSPAIQLRQGASVLTDATVFYTDPALADIRRLNMIEGRWFTEADKGSLAPVVVLTEKLAKQLDSSGGYADLELGSSAWQRARVVGVVEDTMMDDWSGSGTVYLMRSPVSEEIAFPDGLDAPSGMGMGLTYRVRVAPDGTPGEDEFTERLAGNSWRWGPEADTETMGVFRMDESEEIDQVLGYVSLGLFGIAGITLTTGMLGVLNVGLVTVRERRRELATYRALGADRFTMFVVVVSEAVVVSVVAGLIALLGCYGIAGVLQALVGDMLPADVSVSVPLQGVLVGLGSAAAVGLLAGIIPAWRALRTSVVAGLRE
ncbi:putative ABC transport system permease protein [Nocardiopsis composta]|uniref:Putative ABC transport system permease protein n=1 Tax=Nocardiopsis composta TaxID=157465 RepID=A0A7W8QRK4_9ACTN|nr:putative ABC transport system permease protein [Nocardiopsis composta]